MYWWIVPVWADSMSACHWTHMSFLSNADDGAAQSCWQRLCQGDVGRGAISMSSHTGDGTAESYWRWRCQGNLVAAWCRCRVMLVMALSRQLSCSAMSLSSHARDDASESCWRWRCRGNVGCGAMLLPRRLGRGIVSLPNHAGDGTTELCWWWRRNSRLYWLW
jgi:hypothetical protein